MKIPGGGSSQLNSEAANQNPDNLNLSNPSRTTSVGEVASDTTELNITSKEEQLLMTANEGIKSAPYNLLINNTSANINITAPLKLYFGGENGTLDLADLGKDKSVKADAKIQNNGDYYDVVLESIKVQNKGLDSMFKLRTGVAGTILTNQIFSVKDKEGASASPISFAAARNPVEGETGMQDYERTAPKDDTGVWVASNSTESCEFEMSLKDLDVTESFRSTFDASTDEAKNGLSAERSLISVICTFDATSLGIPSYELNSSGYTNSGLSALIENAKKENFFLEVTDPDHVDFGRVYSLSEVKAHANAISDNADSNQTKTYTKFASTGAGYTCSMKYNSSPLGLTILGARQDVRADDTSKYAGITFMCNNAIGAYTRSAHTGRYDKEQYRADLNNPDSENYSPLYRVLNPSSEEQNLVEVSKRTYVHIDIFDVRSFSETMFIPSWWEVFGTVNPYKRTSWDELNPSESAYAQANFPHLFDGKTNDGLGGLGTDRYGSDQYQWFKNHGASDRIRCLLDSDVAINWWLRSYADWVWLENGTFTDNNPAQDRYPVIGGSDGNPYPVYGMHWGPMYILPCFCL